MSELRGRLLCLGVAGLLGIGCVHYQAQPISPSVMLDRFEERRLDDPGLGDFARLGPDIECWPPPAWDLEALTLVAFYYSPELDLARARWGVAQAGPRAAGQRPNPGIALSEGYNVTSVGITPWIPEAVLDIPIETAGKRGLRIRQAEQLSEAARLDVLTAAWRVRARLRRAFDDLFVARRTAALLARRQELENEQVRILETQLAAGEVSPDLVTAARIARDSSRLEALDAAARAEQALLAIADALGVPRAAVAGQPLSFDELESAPPRLPAEEVRRRALISRADILRGLADYEASQTALQIEIARQYPDIDLGAGYQLDQTDGKWTLGLALPIPVLNRNRGAIAEAEARRTEAAARFVELQARVISDVAHAEAAWRAAAERSAASAALVGNLEKRLAAAETAWKLGEIPRLEVVGAERELVAGRLAWLEARARSLAATGDLEEAMESPLEPAPWVLVAPRIATGREGANDETAHPDP